MPTGPGRSHAYGRQCPGRQGQSRVRKQELDAIYNLWRKAETGRELAQKTYDRVRNLYEAGVVPAQKFDEASANLEAAQTTADAAKSQYIWHETALAPKI